VKRWSQGGKKGFKYQVSGRLRRLAIEGIRAHEARDYAKRNRFFSIHDQLFLEEWQAGDMRAKAWRS
jgi:hypothetical protein